MQPSRYRYSPPKSSVWGHGLGRMRAARARELLLEFVTLCVGERAYASGSMNVMLGAPMAPEAEELLSIVGRTFANLDEPHLEQHLEALIHWEARHPKLRAPIVLTQGFALSGWRIGQRIAPAKSMIMMHYGALPSVSTMFSFESLEEFEHVQRVLIDIGLCKLDKRHLKERKRRSG